MFLPRWCEISKLDDIFTTRENENSVQDALARGFTVLGEWSLCCKTAEYNFQLLMMLV